MTIFCAYDKCGKELHLKDWEIRARQSRNPDKKLYCASRCYTESIKKPLVKVICSGCKTEFEIQGTIYRLRMKNSKSGNLYCNIRCNGRRLSYREQGD